MKKQLIKSFQFSELEKEMIKKVDNSLVASRRIRVTFNSNEFKIQVPDDPEIRIIPAEQFLCHQIVEDIPYYCPHEYVNHVTKCYSYANKGEYFENLYGKKLL